MKTLFKIALGLVLAQTAFAAQTKPNIVFIMADDLAWADVGFNGHKFFETPNIDQLAKDGTILNHMYSGGPNCAPTRACIISGMYPPRTKNYVPGGTSKGDPKKMRLAVPGSCPEGDAAFESIAAELRGDDFVSLPGVLKSAGYVTARIGKWHLGDNYREFDFVTADGKKRDGKFYGKPAVTGQLTDYACDFIEKHKDQPFFAYVSLWDVHTPIKSTKAYKAKYTAKNKQQGTKYNPQYAGMVEEVDTCVQRIRAKLETLGIAENTMVIFTSDNGGAYPTSNRPLKGSKGGLYEGGIRVPSVVYWQGKTKAGHVEDTVITSVDLLPTFAEIAGAKLPSGQVIDGSSVLSALLGQPTSALNDRAVFWHFPIYLHGRGAHDVEIPVFGQSKPYFRGTPSSAIRKGDWKLIHYFETDTAELYNIASDPYEKENLATTHPEKHAALFQELRAWQAATDAPVPQGLNPNFRSK